jgi:hypothetical protein
VQIYKYADVQMKRSGILILFVILFAGCDPIYNLNYVVTNKSGQTIWVYHEKSYGDSVALYYVLLKDGNSDTLVKNSGIGYAKPVFEENRVQVIKQMRLYIDTPFTDSTLLVPASDWTYFENRKTEGIAELIVSKNDVNGK